MNDSDRSHIREPRVGSSVDVNVVIAALHLAGADKFDPVGLHYLDVLAQRTSVHHGPVRCILDVKLAHALATFRNRFEHAQRDAQVTIGQIAQHDQQASAALQHLLQIGDVKGVRQGVAILKARGRPTSLGELARFIAQQSPPTVGSGIDGDADLRTELEATQYFRNTWSKLSVDKRVTQALAQAPKNAGPINSHILVLRSLALMREISPDYLNQFTSYVDALLCLDQYDTEKRGSKPKPKKSLRLTATKHRLGVADER